MGKKVEKNLAAPGETLEAGKALVSQLSAAMFAEDAGAGLENTDKDAFSIPMLMLLQQASPQLDRSQPEYIKGAVAGDYLLSATQELFDQKGVLVVLCHYDRIFAKWQKRNEGGKYRGAYTPSEYDALVAAGKIRVEDLGEGKTGEVNEDGEIVRDTRVHYVLVIREDGSWVPAIFSLASTQVKKSKMWLTMIDLYRMEGPNGRFKPPSFAHLWRLTAVGESNDRGNWQGVKIVREGTVEDPQLYEDAKAFYKSMKATPAPMPAAAAANAAGGEEVPF